VIAERYRVDTRTGRDERATRIDFDREGRIERLEIQPPPEHPPVPERYRRGPDPVAALLEVLLAAHAAGEDTVHEVTSFGGIRAVAFTTACARHEAVRLPAGVDLPERALRCEAEGEQLAGPEPRYAGVLGIEPEATCGWPRSRIWRCRCARACASISAS
jgi:hypothetical protein